MDDITAGKEDWIKVLEMFWKDFNKNVSDVKEKRTREVLDLLNDSLGSLIFERDSDGNIDRKCKLCENAKTKNDLRLRGLLEDGFKVYVAGEKKNTQ